MANVGAGIGLLIFGLFLTIVGATAYTACTGMPTVNGLAPNCSGLGVAIGLGILLLLGGIALIVYAVVSRPTRIQPVSDPSVPPPIIRPVVIQQTIVKGVTRVQCPYCGNTYDSTASECPSCGAPVPAASVPLPSS